MPWPPSVFRHLPELRGAMIAPEDSEMRFTDMAAIDARAAEAGRAPGWRLTDDAREADRLRLLGDWRGDLWIFAYGSLIWDPGVHVSDLRRAHLPGQRRSFCFKLEIGRGSATRPALMAALEPGAGCDGVILKIDAAHVQAETEILWRREMLTGIYRPTLLTVETEIGPLPALCLLANTDHERYAGDLSDAERARLIGEARGAMGDNLSYLTSLLDGLHRIGLKDDQMTRLKTAARAAAAARLNTRPATDRDSASAQALCQAAFAGDRPAAVRRPLSEQIAAKGVTLAEDDDLLCGLMLTSVAGDALSVDALATAPAQTRRGVARRLVREAEAMARASGLSRLTLTITEGFEHLIPLCRGYGFQTIRTGPSPHGAVSGPDSGPDGGPPIHMAKPLG